MKEKEESMAFFENLKKNFEEQSLPLFYILEKTKNIFYAPLKGGSVLEIAIEQYSLDDQLLENWKYCISLPNLEDPTRYDEFKESDFEESDQEILKPILKSLILGKLIIINNSRRKGFLSEE